MRALLLPPTLRGYQASCLGPDVVAGLTLVAIAVPEQMATAQLAYMPAVVGLYTFVAGSLLFAALGRSRQMSVGADSTIAPVIGTSLAAIATVGTAHYTHLVSFLALMAGALVIAVGLLRLGWIAVFLSTPVVTGVLAGIAIEILVRQLPAILGLAGGGTTTADRLHTIADQIGHVNGWSVAIACAVFAVIVVAERIDRRIPGALIGLLGSILAVVALGLESRGVRALGAIQGGPPAFGLPSVSRSDIGLLLGPALTIAFLCVVQTAATTRASDADGPVAEDFDRNLVALGAGSLAAGLSGSFAVNSSPPRTEVVTASGGRSQLTSVVAAVVVVGVVLLATGLLQDLPLATLGAILVYIATRLFRLRVLRSILRFNRLEFSLAVVTLLVVAWFGIEQGVILAMLLSLADRTRRTARPPDAVLGRVPGTRHWIPPDVGRTTEQVPCMLVYLMYAPLWYGNADYLRIRVREILDAAVPPVHALVLDANGMADMDYTGAQMLGAMITELKQRGVTICIARSSHLFHRNLKHSGLLHDIGPDRLFATVEDAIDALSEHA